MPVDDNRGSCEEGLRTLHGEKLSSVDFSLDDNVQLHFDGPFLAISGPLTVTHAACSWRTGAPGFRDALCERIGIVVVGSRIEKDRALVLSFMDESVIEIDLDPNLLDAQMPEHGFLYLPDGRWWVL